MQLGLSEKLQGFNGTLSAEEKANFKLLLGLAAGGLAPGFSKPDAGLNALAFDTVTDTLARLQPYSRRISRNGIAYRGRPKIMTDDLLHRLQAEAFAVRPTATRSDELFLGCGAPLANDLAVSPDLISFVSEHAGPAEATGIASFLYYDEPGQGIHPHIDTDVFALNVLLMLAHEYVTEPQSALVIFPPFGEPERIELTSGEMVIMFAGSIAHGREYVKPGERVTIVTFGFQPVGA